MYRLVPYTMKLCSCVLPALLIRSPQALCDCAPAHTVLQPQFLHSALHFSLNMLDSFLSQGNPCAVPSAQNILPTNLHIATSFRLQPDSSGSVPHCPDSIIVLLMAPKMVLSVCLCHCFLTRLYDARRQGLHPSCSCSLSSIICRHKAGF